MTTIQGSISKLVENSTTMFDCLGYISSNIANANTTSYKAQRFETYLDACGGLKGTVRTDYSPGDQVATFRQLDVAIDGAGYIPVTNKNGEISYTRDGSFTVNSEGYIVTNKGWLVGSGIKLPANYKRIKIDTDGTVQILTSQDEPFKKIGKIPVVVFKNPEGLEIAEGNMVKVTDKSGKPELVMDHMKVKQGKLEKANFDPYEFINETMKINGSLLSSTRFISTLNEMYREAINLRS